VAPTIALASLEIEHGRPKFRLGLYTVHHCAYHLLIDLKDVGSPPATRKEVFSSDPNVAFLPGGRRLHALIVPLAKACSPLVTKKKKAI
jgi:hypothetical protein